MSRFEYSTQGEHKDFISIEALFAGYPVALERHKDWLTVVRWALPDEYGIEDFFRVVEDCFQEAEENGYETSDQPKVVIGSLKSSEIQIGEFDRPLEIADLEELGVQPDDINFVRLGDDLAHFYFGRNSTQQVGLLFHEKPHQTRSAFHFMADLLPSESDLEPQEIGAFVLGLPR